MGRPSIETNNASTVEIQGKRAAIEATVEELMGDVRPFVEDYAQAVETLDDLSCANRARAVLAVKMMADAALDRAALLSEGMRAIAEGTQSAADYGFPEFEDDVAEGLAD